MLSDITLQYIALANKKGTFMLLKKAGFDKYDAPVNPPEAASMLSDLQRHGGDKAYKAILEIHPDKSLFQPALPAHEEAHPAPPVHADGDPDNVMNCDSCNKKMNCIAADATSAKAGLSEKTINTIIIAGAGVFAIGLLTLIIMNKK